MYGTENLYKDWKNNFNLGLSKYCVSTLLIVFIQ